jgi:restriction system protein
MEERDNLSLEEAFAALLQLIEDKRSEVHQQIQLLNDMGDYRQLSRYAAYAEQIRGYEEKIERLRDEGIRLFAQQAGASFAEPNRASPTRSSRLAQGRRTPEENFVCPILQALDEFGGAARIGLVLDRVGEIMQDVLTEADYETLESSNEPRWRNTAQWCRNSLCDKGLMARGRRGLWEITDAGRAYLRDQCGHG